jgi:hypothetical protein
MHCTVPGFISWRNIEHSRVRIEGLSFTELVSYVINHCVVYFLGNLAEILVLEKFQTKPHKYIDVLVA